LTAEQGEAKEAYADVLEEKDLPLPLKQILVTQQEHILRAHDKIKGLRDSKAA